MQLQLEDTVLHLLSTATGSLLDNIELINTLDQSKTTWEEVNESLKVAEETTRQIEVASAQYRPCSARAAILYFVLNDLAGAHANALCCSACSLPFPRKGALPRIQAHCRSHPAGGVVEIQWMIPVYNIKRTRLAVAGGTIPAFNLL
jgi:hypothetical protein